MPDSPSATPTAASALRRLADSWNRTDWLEVGALAAVIAALHVVGFGALILFVAPHHYQVGTQVLGIGLGVTAYTFGLRHAFDADHAVEHRLQRRAITRQRVNRPFWSTRVGAADGTGLPAAGRSSGELTARVITAPTMSTASAAAALERTIALRLRRVLPDRVTGDANGSAAAEGGSTGGRGLAAATLAQLKL